MTDFSAAAVDPVFSEFGETAVYESLAAEQTEVTVIRRMPDRITGFGESAIFSGTAVFEVRVSELAAPVKGGKIIYNATNYIIQSPPERQDDLQLVWVLDTCTE